MRIEYNQRPALEAIVHWIYRRALPARVGSPLFRQRLKMLWYAPGYWPLLSLPLPPRTRLTLLFRFLRVDWHVLHGHTPNECAAVCRALAERPAGSGEALLEAGCWRGGSSAKWSIVCSVFGYRLAVYDSFQGVNETNPPEGEYNFSGEYAAEEHVVWENLRRYGEAGVCQTHRGWFSETLAAGKIPFRVRVAYIDCDTAEGTKEALTGIIPALTERAYIFSQDCHIPSVLKLLRDPATWEGFGTAVPVMTRIDRRLARFDVNSKESP